MIFDVQKFYSDYCVPVTTRGKHVRKGWLNTTCPFCNMDGGIGVHIATGAVKCWGCGKHSQIDLLMKLFRFDYSEAKELLDEYTNKRNPKQHTETKDTPRESKNTVCTYPCGTAELTERHKRYLVERGFNVSYLQNTFGLLGTGNLGDYKFRIIAPIYYRGIFVSYQGRDITGKSDLRYKACKQENEVIPHQEVLYAYDLVERDRCLVVEGITDCWRMGPGAVCCFGIAFTIAQVNLLASFRQVYILFDAEEQAQRQARILAVMLAARGVEVEILDISDTKPEELIHPEKGIDPANLKQSVADNIMAELGFW